MLDWMRSPGAVLVAVLGLALAGCGDSNLFEGQSRSSGTQADLEAGLEALDNSDWATAQRIFSGMDQGDPDVRKYLASAYVGEAGFDVLTLVEEIDAAQADGTSDDGIYDMVTSIFDDGDGKLTDGEIAAKVDLLLEALTALHVYDPSVARASRTAGAVSFDTIAPENRFQAGLYSAVYVVLAVVEQLADPVTGDVLLTLSSLQSADACQIIGPLPAAEADGGVAAPAAFDDLLSLVRQAVLVLVPDYMGGPFDNDIAQELDRFLAEIGYLPDATVSSTELRSYLYGLFDNTCAE
ncbi:MAG TPA: hypothetical protein VK997_00270 [Deferrisomatales bacterium]|nr:hypothetical protein [Deferrisomatales bacterium]